MGMTPQGKAVPFLAGALVIVALAGGGWRSIAPVMLLGRRGSARPGRRSGMKRLSASLRYCQDQGRAGGSGERAAPSGKNR